MKAVVNLNKTHTYSASTLEVSRKLIGIKCICGKDALYMVDWDDNGVWEPACVNIINPLLVSLMGLEEYVKLPGWGYDIQPNLDNPIP